MTNSNAYEIHENTDKRKLIIKLAHAIMKAAKSPIHPLASRRTRKSKCIIQSKIRTSRTRAMPESKVSITKCSVSKDRTGNAWMPQPQNITKQR